MTKKRGLKILAALLMAWAVGAPHGSSAEPRGSLDLAEANALLKAYAVHFVEQQPNDMRKTWRGQLDRVRLNQHGLFGLTGVDGRIIFEYLPESKIFHCLSPIHAFRRRVVRPWVYRALKEAAAGGVSTNDAELIYDPVSKGIFLRRTFRKSPVSEKAFIKTCDSVMKTGERWRRKHFLPALETFYARHAPPASAVATQDGFKAILILTEDQAAFRSVWDRPSKFRVPAIWTLDKVAVGGPAHAFVLFSGCPPDASGRCPIRATFQILRPDGSSLVSVPEIPLWNDPPPPPGHLQIAGQSLKIAIDKGEPRGTYRLVGKVCNGASKRCVELSLPFEVIANRP